MRKTKLRITKFRFRYSVIVQQSKNDSGNRKELLVIRKLRVLTLPSVIKGYLVKMISQLNNYTIIQLQELINTDNEKFRLAKLKGQTYPALKKRRTRMRILENKLQELKNQSSLYVPVGLSSKSHS